MLLASHTLIQHLTNYTRDKYNRFLNKNKILVFCNKIRNAPFLSWCNKLPCNKYNSSHGSRFNANVLHNYISSYIDCLHICTHFFRGGTVVRNTNLPKLLVRKEDYRIAFRCKNYFPLLQIENICCYLAPSVRLFVRDVCFGCASKNIRAIAK